ncbi:MAG TPA: hypothetical protein VHA12_03390 [Candidatus Nanoarchaeia archaeon]|nr:hypothetical protein [Candidatus Nanoarchaeia archaeon]
MQTLEMPGIAHWNSHRKVCSPSLREKIDDGSEIDHKKRIVLVSPFASFNFLFEHTLQQLTKDKKAEVDVLDVAEIPTAPYVNVNLREKLKESLPYCVVDFCRIGIDAGGQRVMGDFRGYLHWTTETVKTMKDLRTRYLIPKPDGEIAFRLGNYLNGRTFDPYSFRVSDLNEMIKEDLKVILNNSDEGFYLFGEAVAIK